MIPFLDGGGCLHKNCLDSSVWDTYPFFHIYLFIQSFIYISVDSWIYILCFELFILLLKLFQLHLDHTFLIDLFL